MLKQPKSGGKGRKGAVQLPDVFFLLMLWRFRGKVVTLSLYSAAGSARRRAPRTKNAESERQDAV